MGGGEPASTLIPKTMKIIVISILAFYGTCFLGVRCFSEVFSFAVWSSVARLTCTVNVFRALATYSPGSRHFDAGRLT